MKIAFYGSSLLSSYWNGAATYYRGLLKALAARGHSIVFFEPDAFGRGARRDIAPPDWCRVVVYHATPQGLREAAARAAEADAVVKTSGVGYEDDALLLSVMQAAAPRALKIFWDVDAPATLAELRAQPIQPLRRLLRDLDLVLTYGGGDPVVRAYEELGAARCRPIYNGLDPTAHHPAPPQSHYTAALSFLGNRLPDREARVDEYFFAAAVRRPNDPFLLGGAGWETKLSPANVRSVGHVPTEDHNAFNCSARAVLNVNRERMAEIGFSPPTRIFEAAGAAACVITDAWPGVESFFAPHTEILIARDGRDVAEALSDLTPERAATIGRAALRRALRDHCYDRRAAEVDTILLQAFEIRREAAA